MGWRILYKLFGVWLLTHCFTDPRILILFFFFYFICMAASQCQASLQSEVCQQINFSVKWSTPEQQLSSLFLILHSVWHYDSTLSGAGGRALASWLPFSFMKERHLHDRSHSVSSQIGVCRRQQETSWSISRHGSRQKGAEPQREQC